MRRATSVPRPEPAAVRSARHHELIGHTADSGISASGPDLPALFEEAAAALAESSAIVAPGVTASTVEDVSVDGDDLEHLAFAWLNELIGLSEIRGGAIVAVEVERVTGPDAAGVPGASRRPGQWKLGGRVWFCSLGTAGVQPVGHVKAATYHGLRVERLAGAWTLRAYLDV